MKITNIELDKPIDEYIRNLIIEYYEKYAIKPTIIIISKPLFSWFKKCLMEKQKYSLRYSWKAELECDLMTFEGLNIIQTYKDNIIDVY